MAGRNTPRRTKKPSSPKARGRGQPTRNTRPTNKPKTVSSGSTLKTATSTPVAKPATTPSVPKSAPAKTITRGAAMRAGFVGGIVGGTVAGAAASVLTPTEVGMGERRNNEQAISSQREADLMTTQAGTSLSRGPKTRGKAGPSPNRTKAPVATRTAENPPYAGTSKPMVKSTSTSGTTQATTSTSRAHKEAHNIPVAESRAMKGAVAGISESLQKKQATSTGYKDPYANTRLKPRMRGYSDR